MGRGDRRQPARGRLRRGRQGPVDPGRDAPGHHAPRAPTGPTPDNLKLEGIDFYHRYAEDIALFAEMGFTRVPVLDRLVADLPQRRRARAQRGGPGVLRPGPRRVRASTASNPLVTISHYETPLHLAETYDGWVSRDLIGFYERYVRVLFDRYGHRVKYWLTFNEINSVLHAPFVSGGDQHPQGPAVRVRPVPGGPPRAGRLRAGHQDRPRDDPRRQGRLHGHLDADLPADPGPGRRAGGDARRPRQPACSATCTPAAYYPGYALRHFRENGIELDITDEDREILTNTVDFVSFSYYMSICETADPAKKTTGEGNIMGGVPNPTLAASRVGLADRPGRPADRAQPVLGPLAEAAVHRRERARAPRTSSSRSTASRPCSTTTGSPTSTTTSSRSARRSPTASSVLGLHHVGPHRPGQRHHRPAEQAVRLHLRRPQRRRHRHPGAVQEEVLRLVRRGHRHQRRQPGRPA